MNITEESINRHAKDATGKIQGDKKIKHRGINDDTSCVSSIHLTLSRALRVRMPTKTKNIVVPAPPNPPYETNTDFTLPMTVPQTSNVIAEPPSSPKRKAAMRATTTTQPSQKRRRSSPSITESDESMASTKTCPPKSGGKQRTNATEETPNAERTANKEQIYNLFN